MSCDIVYMNASRGSYMNCNVELLNKPVEMYIDLT